ncbi:GNAT family N-acetyltransferase [Prosthecomicrobium sp. N25]|uniref:GNAT family N-acetyltransferase n=1 Tax=Prosthecomicrobium sp. N25 TaxID=3129254 RepID=UPI003077C34D
MALAVPATPPPGAETVEIIRSADAGVLVEDWRRLAAGAGEPNVFLTPDFLLPQLACFAPSAEIATVRSADGRLVGLAPVVAGRLASGLTGAVPTLWCNEYAPLGTPLVAAGAEETFWTAILQYQATRANVIAVRDMRLDGPVFRALEAVADRAGQALHIAGRHARAALAGGEDWDTYAARAFDRKRRKETARLWRRLAERGDACSDVVTAPDAVREAFEAFLALEASGWKGRAGTAMAGLPEVAAFARAAIDGLAGQGAVAIDRIRLDGRLVAAVVRLSSGGRTWPWKTAFAEDLAPASPGVQVMIAATERLFAVPGFAGADSLATADHPMIDPLWRDRIEIGTVAVDLGGMLPRARLVAADVAGWLALRRAARRGLEMMAREMGRLGLGS